ncbi:MAG: helix-turn-helix transcriptional regulator [Coprobacillus cateniformis]|uniref:helix-turn-helix transcriptional regulator n=1 Tax=Longibaculum muris TaxID=1796628 RepID=UPI003AB3249D|nr:helix-turn-helix transcriptional regulator [Coprobacillus cateniformis]
MLGENLMKLRKKQGLSQQAVADLLNVSRQTISNWELNQGAPTIDKAKELAKLYHVSLDDLTENEVEVVCSKQRDVHVLYNLIGKLCKIDCKESSLYLDSPSKDQFLVLDVNEQWLKVKYQRRKGISLKKEYVIKLIDLNDINGFEIVGENNE